MAIQADYLAYNGTEYKNTYIRVFEIKVSEKSNMQVYFGVNLSAEDPHPFESFIRNYEYDLSKMDNVYALAYNSLKKEFVNSEDV